MPKLLGDILTVTVEELVPLCYNKYGSLAKALKRYEEKPYGIKRAMLGGNGRELLVTFDSLPKKYQQLIGDPRKADHILENYYKVDKETVDFYTTFQFEDGEYLSDDAQDKHITNATILKACIALENDRRTERHNKGGSMRNLTKSVFNDYLSFRSLKEDKSPETFKCTLPQHYNRWLPDAFKAFKVGKYEGIIKRYKSNTNAQKVRKNKEEKLLNDLFSAQEHKPYVSEIAQQYEAFLNNYIDIVNHSTGEFYDSKEYRAISERTIKNYLTKWENKIGTHTKRSGDRQVLMSKFKPHHSFDRPHFAGSLYSIDDRQPPFKYETGERMWFYIGMDVASTALTAYVWGKSKKELIINFYRQVVRNYHEWGFHLPDALEAEMSLNSSFMNTFLRPGYMFQNVRIEANNARGKAIEREFGNLRYGQEKQLEGWIPRPHAKNEANQVKPGTDVLIPYDELVMQSIGQLEEWNNSPHPDEDKKHVTRYEYFRDNQHPDLTPTNYRAFLPHLGYKTSTSVNVGIIRLQNREWLLGDNGKIATGEKLISLMKKIEGYDVDVYWLDDNNGEVFQAHVYIGDHFICEAISKPKPNRAPIERTPAQNEAMALMSRYVKTIEVYQKTRKNELEGVEVIKLKSRTLNSAFVTPQFRPQKEKTPRPARDEVLELTEAVDDSLTYQPQEDTGGGWRTAFND